METEDAAILTADLPGCKKEDVDAQVSEDGGIKTLTITALRKKTTLAKKESIDPPSPDTSGSDERVAKSAEAAAPAEAVDETETLTASSSTSAASSSPSYTEESFKLSFRVGDGIDVSGIRGSLEDGVLTLVLPKLAPEPPAEPIEIPIDFAAGSRSVEGAARTAASIGRGGVSEDSGSTAEADTHISLS